MKVEYDSGAVQSQSPPQWSGASQSQTHAQPPSVQLPQAPLPPGGSNAEPQLADIPREHKVNGIMPHNENNNSAGFGASASPYGFPARSRRDKDFEEFYENWKKQGPDTRSRGDSKTGGDPCDPNDPFGKLKDNIDHIAQVLNLAESETIAKPALPSSYNPLNAAVRFLGAKEGIIDELKRKSDDLKTSSDFQPEYDLTVALHKILAAKKDEDPNILEADLKAFANAYDNFIDTKAEKHKYLELTPADKFNLGTGNAIKSANPMRIFEVVTSGLALDLFYKNICQISKEIYDDADHKKGTPDGKFDRLGGALEVPHAKSLQEAVDHLASSEVHDYGPSKNETKYSKVDLILNRGELPQELLIKLNRENKTVAGANHAQAMELGTVKVRFKEDSTKASNIKFADYNPAVVVCRRLDKANTEQYYTYEYDKAKKRWIFYKDGEQGYVDEDAAKEDMARYAIGVRVRRD